MSLLDSLIQNLVGVSGSSSVEHPCQNCPSDCALAPGSCNVCKPYKEKLIDAIYNVEHIDEIRAKYVVSSVAQSQSVICPHCNATSSSAVTCDYCGSALGGTSDVIVVESAKDIPNPILEAQDIIFARYSAVKGGTGTSGDSDFLSQIFSLLGDESDESALGAKMTEEEIKQVAASYGVSVATYLNGLDNGRYLTYQGKKAASKITQNTSTNVPANANVPGLAGMAVAAILGSAISSGASQSSQSSIFGSSFGNNSSNRPHPQGFPGGQSGFGGMGSQTGFGRQNSSSSHGNHGGPGRPGGGMGGHGGFGGPGGGMGGRGGFGGGPGRR